ncbi:hypothetical protein HY633_01765, partial [Candidatus Uhrbacteria bacterium]|nr:hypothetical protein [Candidatus Uhrbacteria bacterium]
NVGIGDASPDSLLDVLSSGAANTVLKIANTNAGDFDPVIGFELAEGTHSFTMGVDDSDSDKFKIGTTAIETNTRLTIDSSGNVGIGITAPTAKAHIVQSAAADSFRVDDTDTSETTPFVIAQDGTVGIGVAIPSPSYKVDVSSQALGIFHGVAAGPATVAGPLFDIYDTARATELVISSTDNTVVGPYIASFTNHPLLFGTNAGSIPAAKMTLSTAGNVGIGTTSPLARLDLAGNLRTTGKATAVLTGSIDPAASTAVTGVGTLFLTQLVVGDRIVVTGETRTVAAIASDTSLTVDTAFTDNANDTSPDVLYALSTARDSSNALKFVINDIGNVGIGITSPVGKLHVRDATSSNSPTELFSIHRSRNDATAPGAADFGSDFIYHLEGFTDSSDVSAIRIRGAWEAAQTNDTTDRDSYLSFATMVDNTLTERMRVTSAGYISLGDPLVIGGGSHGTPGTSTTIVGQAATADGLESTAFGKTAAANGSESSAFGFSAVASGTQSTAFGETATANNTGATAYGQNAMATSSVATAIGWDADATASQSTAIGADSLASGLSSTALGHLSTASGASSTALGKDASAGFTNSIAIGFDAETTAANQLVIGAFASNNIADVYIGEGVTDVSPSSTVYHATGGSGTDIGGAALTFAGGRGTGTGAGGALTFQTAAAGLTGASLNALTERMRIDSAGNVGIGTTAPSVKLEVKGDDNTAFGVADGGQFMLRGSTDPNYKFMFSMNTTSGYGAVQVTQTSTGLKNLILQPGNDLNLTSNVGIGTTSPGSKLEVKGAGSSSATSAMNVTNSSGTSALYVRNDGNVGIGDTGPTAKLSVANTANQDGLKATQATTALTTAGNALLKISSATADTSDQLMLLEATSTSANYGNGGANSGIVRILNASTATVGTTATNPNVAGLFLQTADSDTISTLIRNNATTITMADVGTAGAQGDPGVLTIEGNDTTNVTLYNLITAYNSTTRSDAAAVFRVRADGNVYGEAAFNASGADYAEYFPTQDTTIATAELVALDVSATSHASEIVKATASGASYIVGVISQNPAFVGGNPGGSNDNSPDHKLVALMGRVMIKVGNENGPIAVGDPLTASSTPGIAAKATNPGRVVGIAMESFNGTESGEIMVFVNPGWWNGATVQNGNASSGADDLATISGDLDLHGHAMLNVRSIAGANGSWSIDESGLLKIKEVVTEKLTLKNTDARKTVGQGNIPLGSDATVVINPAIKATGKIFITFRNSPHTFWSVTNINDGSFVLKLDAPAIEEIVFDYWFIDVIDATTPVPEAPAPAEPTPQEPPAVPESLPQPQSESEPIAETMQEPEPEPEPAPEPIAESPQQQSPQEEPPATIESAT